MRNVLTIGVVAILVGACTSGTVTTTVTASPTSVDPLLNPRPLIADFCDHSREVVDVMHGDLALEVSLIEASVVADVASFQEVADPQAAWLIENKMMQGGLAIRIINTAFDLARFKGAGGLDELRGRVHVLSRSIAIFLRKYC